MLHPLQLVPILEHQQEAWHFIMVCSFKEKTTCNINWTVRVLLALGRVTGLYIQQYLHTLYYMYFLLTGIRKEISDISYFNCMEYFPEDVNSFSLVVHTEDLSLLLLQSEWHFITFFQMKCHFITISSQGRCFRVYLYCVRRTHTDSFGRWLFMDKQHLLKMKVSIQGQDVLEREKCRILCPQNAGYQRWDILWVVPILISFLNFCHVRVQKTGHWKSCVSV